MKPEWFKIRPPSTENFNHIKQVLSRFNLKTVCQEAHCPNMADCWDCGTATIMVLGDTCTRGCSFCNIKTNKNGQDLDPFEPNKIASALKEIGVIDYIVLTSVDRDDLPDGGADHFANCITKLKETIPGILVEVLIPDFKGNKELIQKIIDANPDVIGHNIETVKSLQSKVRDSRANYEQSLEVLKYVKQNSNILTKSSIMLGLGESKDEIIQSMKDLRNIDVDIFTLGQYLQPSKNHLKVKKYIHPTKFQDYKNIGESLGFKFVASGPFIRSSYKAGELFVRNIKKNTIIEHNQRVEQYA